MVWFRREVWFRRRVGGALEGMGHGAWDDELGRRSISHRDGSHTS